MRAMLLAVALVLGACAASDQAERSATSGCLFWSTDCTRLDAAPPNAPLPLDTEGRPPVPPPLAASLPRREIEPGVDLGRFRASREPRRRDRAGEAAFEQRFAGERTAPPAETIFPLPSNCTSPPSTLLRNSPGGRFAPGRNSAAAGIYAQVYRRCGEPGTWPRP